MVAEFLVVLFAGYAALGIVFALVFVTLGAPSIDSQARGSGWGFRALIFPGAAALWPLLLGRWLAGRSEPPVEQNPHRRAALSGASR